MNSRIEKIPDTPDASTMSTKASRTWGLGYTAGILLSSMFGFSGCASTAERDVDSMQRETAREEPVVTATQAVVSNWNMVLPSTITPSEVLFSATNGIQIGDRANLSGGQISNTGAAELNIGVDAVFAKTRTTSVGLVRARGNNDRSKWIDGPITTANLLVIENNAQVAGPVTQNATIRTTQFPRSVDFPNNAGVDVPVLKGATKQLSAGNYGKITVYEGGTLKLAGGKYYAAEVDFEPGANVLLQDGNKPVELFVKTKLIYRGNVSEEATGSLAGNVMVTYLGTTEAFLEAPWIGTLFAPSALITLGPLNSKVKKHRGAFFGKSLQVRPDTLIEFLPFPSYLITNVDVSTTTPCANQSVTVTATTRNLSDASGSALPEVAINGGLAAPTATGSTRYVQFLGTGPRKILVSARSGTVTDSRIIDVNVMACTQKYPRLVVTPSTKPYEIEFSIPNANELNGNGLTYVWTFGDGQQAETTDPWISHSYAAAVSATNTELVFQATLTVKRSGQADVTVPKTVVIPNVYALMAARGFVRPLVTTDSRMTFNGRALEGAFTLRNVESGAITFTSQQIQRQFCDPDKAPVTDPAESIAVSLPGGGTSSQVLTLDRHVYGRDVCGIRVSWTGKTADNLNAVVDVNFDTPSVPLLSAPVTDATTKALLNQLASTGQVSNSNRITLEELENLKKKGKIISVPRVSAASGGVLSGANDLLGQPCDPTLPNDDHPELICQATDDWTIVPPMVRNGLKGDLILVSACEQVGMMLRKMQARQYYSHEAMFTRNYLSIAENTAVVTYMMTGAQGLGDKLNGDLLKWAWPGSIQQNVATAFSELLMKAPDDTLQSITTFRPEAARCLDDANPAPALVVRPHPTNEETARPTLHKLADWELNPSNHTHYRLFAYSQANISFEGAENYNGGDFRSPRDGTAPAVSSTFHWLASKKNDITLEGTSLETLLRPYRGATNEAEFPLLARLPSGTAGVVDGLYRYTEQDRRDGGKYIYASTYNMVSTMQDAGLYSMFGWSADVMAGLIEFFTGSLESQRTQIAGQVTSCFGADYCAASDDPSCPCWWEPIQGTDPPQYQQVCPPKMTVKEQAACWPTHVRDNPGEGAAVSPDNFLFWDAPNYGYYEYLSYRSGEFGRVHRWVANPTTTGQCGGTVVFSDGTPVANAVVVMQGSSVGTDASGQFHFSALNSGDYEVKAQYQYTSPPELAGVTLWDSALATVPPNGSCTPVRLVLTVDGPFEDMKPVIVAQRRVTFSGTLKITDDENVSDEHWGSDGNLSGECVVSPAHRRVVLRSVDLVGDNNPCAGGEVNTNLEVTCELDENDLNNENVRVSVRMVTVEGTDCYGGSDLFDDREEDSKTFGPAILRTGESVDTPLNTRIEGGDNASLAMTITNGTGSNITINPIKEENRRKVIFTGSVKLNDSEWAASDETADDVFYNECYVDPLNPEDEILWYSPCAGGELHAVVTIKCSLAVKPKGDPRAVTVTTNVKLYEGTTCTSTDEDGTGDRSTTPIAPCPSDAASCPEVWLNTPQSGNTLQVDNDDEGGGDYIQLDVRVQNIQQNAATAGP